MVLLAEDVLPEQDILVDYLELSALCVQKSYLMR
jgi:hypothetical protein